MEIDFIKIDIRDKKFFTYVALIVDRPEFLDQICNIRKRFIGSLKPYSEIKYKNFKREIYDTKILSDLNREIEKSRIELHLPFNFRKILEVAALLGKIRENDFKLASLEETINTYNTKQGEFVDTIYKIVLSPGVRDKDVLSELQIFRDQLGNKKNNSKYEYIPLVWDIQNSKSSIKKHRKWYIKFKSGIYVTQICNEEKRHIYDESTIRKGIEAYESLIRKTSTL